MSQGRPNLGTTKGGRRPPSSQYPGGPGKGGGGQPFPPQRFPGGPGKGGGGQPFPSPQYPGGPGKGGGQPPPYQPPPYYNGAGATPVSPQDYSQMSDLERSKYGGGVGRMPGDFQPPAGGMVGIGDFQRQQQLPMEYRDRLLIPGLGDDWRSQMDDAARGDYEWREWQRRQMELQGSQYPGPSIPPMGPPPKPGQVGIGDFERQQQLAAQQQQLEASQLMQRLATQRQQMEGQGLAPQGGIAGLGGGVGMYKEPAAPPMSYPELTSQQMDDS